MALRKTFLGMNIALTGIPLGLFIIFSLTVAVFALIVGLVIGLLAAGLFTITCIGIALSFVFPIVFFTTMAACFLFLWGVGGYHLLQWINGGSDIEAAKSKPLLSSGSIGESLNLLAGGRLDGFMENAKANKAKSDIRDFSDEHAPPKRPPKKEKSSSQTHSKQQQGAFRRASISASSVQDATKGTGVDGKVKTATNATGVVKGGLSGATGLG